MASLLHLAVPWWELIVRAVAVYIVLLFGLRLFGKREVGQFTLFDLVFVLLVANAVQPAMTGPDSSLLGGVIIIGSLILANWVVGKADEVPFVHRLLTTPPQVLATKGELDRRAMRREGIDLDELMMAAREHGIADLKEVELAVLESDGSISIVGKDGATHKKRRRSRFVRRS